MATAARAVEDRTAGAAEQPEAGSPAAERLLGVLNDGCLALMISLGHRSGLFEAMADLPPSTSEEVARAAELDERYVREWLGAMLVGGIVRYDPARRTYRLPEEQAAFLTRRAGPDNLAVLMQYVAVLAGVEDRVLECFRHGGGVPYSAYPRFQQVQAEETRAVFDATLLDRTLPLVPGLVERLRAGIEVAEIGCGQGHALNLMAAAFPNSRLVGLDLSKEGVAAARAQAAVQGLENVSFVVKDVATLDSVGRYDLVTAFDAIHDQAEPRRVLRNVARALRPDGRLLMVDIRARTAVHENLDHPLGALLYSISCMHCMTVSLAQGGEGLGTAWGEEKALELLREAGFARVDVRQVEGDIMNSYYVASRG